MAPMKFFRDSILVHREEKKHFKRAPSFVPAGQTTQLIVGASGESDRQILLLTEGLYRAASLKRVYYSAYVPVMKGKNLPAIKRPPLNRENRLYQADWLLRFYKFRAEEYLYLLCWRHVASPGGESECGGYLCRNSRLERQL